MNFSELFRHSKDLCLFSPDGKYLASATDYRLVVRDVDTLQITNLFSCLDNVQYIEWSSDSEFILCGMLSRGIIQVWSLEQPEWTCKIDEGSAGLRSVRWSPDGRHILATADFNLRITIWSLVNKSVSYIRYPKQCEKGMDFSVGGKYMALVERRDCRDYISIFDCASWELVMHFETDTDDLAGLSWSPEGKVLCIWESSMNYKILIYSLDGRCLKTYSAYEYALGIKHVAWSSSSQFLAIGSYDEKVRILNHLTWQKIVEFSHPDTLKDSNVIVYKELETRSVCPAGNLPVTATGLFTSQSKYEVVTNPVVIPVVKPNIKKANPKMGVGSVAFSYDCKYMYTRNDNMPNVLWIWDIKKLHLCVVLIQTSPIKCVQWDKTETRLALCTATNKLYMWSPSGSLAVEIPVEASFAVTSLQWHHQEKALLLLGKDQFCVCFISNP